MSARLFQLLFLLIVCLLCNCAGQREAISSEPQSKQNELQIPPANEVADDASPDDRFDRPVLDAKGLIVRGDNESSDLLRFYERDGTVWYEFTFYYDDSDGHFEYENHNFRPFSFHADYFTLALRLTGEDSKYYDVIVNEETALRKYVKKGDKNFKVVSWQNHILETFAIDFDKELNPVRQTPGGSVKDTGALKVDRYGAKSFDGDWLKIEWDVSGNEHDDDSSKDSGWIRWRQGNRLLIDWFYFA